MNFEEYDDTEIKELIRTYEEMRESGYDMYDDDEDKFYRFAYDVDDFYNTYMFDEGRMRCIEYKGRFNHLIPNRSSLDMDRVKERGKHIFMNVMRAYHLVMPDFDDITVEDYDEDGEYLRVSIGFTVSYYSRYLRDDESAERDETFRNVFRLKRDVDFIYVGDYVEWVGEGEITHLDYDEILEEAFEFGHRVNFAW